MLRVFSIDGRQPMGHGPKFRSWRIFSGSRDRFRNRRKKTIMIFFSRGHQHKGKIKNNTQNKRITVCFGIFSLLKFIYCALKWLHKLLLAEFTSLFQIMTVRTSQKCPCVHPGSTVETGSRLVLTTTLLKKIKGTWSAPSLVCGHSQVQLLEDMHNCTSLKSLMLKKQLTKYLQWVWHNHGTSLKIMISTCSFNSFE